MVFGNNWIPCLLPSITTAMDHKPGVPWELFDGYFQCVRHSHSVFLQKKCFTDPVANVNYVHLNWYNVFHTIWWNCIYKSIQCRKKVPKSIYLPLSLNCNYMGVPKQFQTSMNYVHLSLFHLSTISFGLYVYYQLNELVSNNSWNSALHTWVYVFFWNATAFFIFLPTHFFYFLLPLICFLFLEVPYF